MLLANNSQHRCKGTQHCWPTTSNIVANGLNIVGQQLPTLFANNVANGLNIVGQQLPKSLQTDSTLLANNSQHCCKRTQHCWPTIPDIVECYLMCPFTHPVACFCVLLGVVARRLKLVKVLSQQLLTFFLFRDHRSVAQQCCIRLHDSHSLCKRTCAVGFL